MKGHVDQNDYFNGAFINCQQGASPDKPVSLALATDALKIPLIDDNPPSIEN
jgi:hypothetical protein